MESPHLEDVHPVFFLRRKYTNYRYDLKHNLIAEHSGFEKHTFNWPDISVMVVSWVLPSVFTRLQQELRCNTQPSSCYICWDLRLLCCRQIYTICKVFAPPNPKKLVNKLYVSKTVSINITAQPTKYKLLYSYVNGKKVWLITSCCSGQHMTAVATYIQHNIWIVDTLSQHLMYVLVMMSNQGYGASWGAQPTPCRLLIPSVRTPVQLDRNHGHI